MPRPGALSSRRRDVGAVQLGDGGHQRKSQAITGPRPAGFAAVKTLEQFGMFLARHAGAVIVYRDQRPLTGARQQKRDVRSLGCMQDRVLDQVGEQLDDQGPVAADGGRGLQLSIPDDGRWLRPPRRTCRAYASTAAPARSGAKSARRAPPSIWAMRNREAKSWSISSVFSIAAFSASA